MNWQPIETAPKDGSLIWCYEPDIYAKASQYVAFFCNGGWVTDDGDQSFWMNPTHWQRLPEPPAA